MANASTDDAVPSSAPSLFGVASTNLRFSSSLSTPLGFSRWAYESSPYCSLARVSSVLESSFSSAHDTLTSPVDVKFEIGEEPMQDPEPSSSHLSGGPCSQVCLKQC